MAKEKKGLAINPNREAKASFVSGAEKPAAEKSVKKKAKVFQVSMPPEVFDRLNEFLAAHPGERNRSALLVRAFETYAELVENEKIGVRFSD